MSKKTELDKTLDSLHDLNERRREGMDYGQYLAAVDHLLEQRGR
jgi:hypothetical protein